MINNNWASRSLYLPVHRFIYAAHFNKLQAIQSVEQSKLFDHIQINKCHFTSANIILIIGESYNKHHSQLYGYQLCTTPHQKQRAERQELFVFNDALTTYNITIDAFKNMFSTNDLSNKENWSKKPLFTQIFRKAGYHTSFITNQFAGKPLSKTQFDYRNIQMYNDDIHLLSEYKKICKSTLNRKYKLIIFHLYGQHFDYKNRFPKDSTYFTISDYKRDNLNESELEIIANYDNSTRYNDYVINKIINQFEDKDAIIVHLADHGEECYDEIKKSGRTHSPITWEIAKNEFQIPFWIWCSHSYQKKHPEIINNIITSVNKPFFSDDLPHLLMYLAGIKTSFYNPKYNIISPDYDINRKRLLRGVTDYNNVKPKYN